MDLASGKSSISSVATNIFLANDSHLPPKQLLASWVLDRQISAASVSPCRQSGCSEILPVAAHEGSQQAGTGFFGFYFVQASPSQTSKLPGDDFLLGIHHCKFQGIPGTL